MKRILLCLICIFYAHFALAESCANGAGTIVSGVDGTRYCISNAEMNWWSAFSWCESAHGKLFDINTECYKAEGDKQCPNLAKSGSSEAWTANKTGPMPSIGGRPGAYVVSTNGSISYSHAGWYYQFTEKHKALCTLNSGY